jgi:valyl-tRNA synthetase
LTKDAKINEAGAPYTGMDRFECRKKIWADMKEAGLVIKEEPYMMNIPRSQRSGEIIEPMVSTQWFLKMKPLAEPALEAVRNGSITIIPDRFTKVYYNGWKISGLVLSRQLGWGHRIPVWYCQTVEKFLLRGRYRSLSKCAVRISNRSGCIDTWFSPGYGHFQPSAGRKRRLTINISIRLI